MRYSITVKFIVFLLAACLMVACGFCIVSIVFMESNDLYTSDLETQRESWYKSLGHKIAWDTAHRYAAENLGKCSNAVIDSLYDKKSKSGSPEWHVVISEDGKVLQEISRPISEGTVLTYNIPTEYPVATEVGTLPLGEKAPTVSGEPTVPGDTNLPLNPPHNDSLYRSEITVWENGVPTDYSLQYYTGPTYLVTVTMTKDAFRGTSYGSLINFYPHRMDFIVCLAVGLVLLAASLVFLFLSAARTKDGKQELIGLNRAPLDLYLIIVVLIEWGLSYGFVQTLRWIGSGQLSPGNLSLLLINAVVICLIALGYLYAIAGQVKIEDRFWWHNSIIGGIMGKVFHVINLCSKGVISLIEMVPLLWQWLATAGCMAIFTTTSFWLLIVTHGGWKVFSGFFFALCFGGCLAIVGYGGYAFGILLKGAEKMADGDLSYKIPTRYLIGNYKHHAERINALSETAMVAAQNHLKSERTKTELITNVTHDIKTPLTSIINFVDLLQKPHTEEDEKQYLEVLSRQSHRLKRLIEDLMELSKANTGNMPTNIVQLDACEAVSQALGEFSDKLEDASLTPVFHEPEDSLMIKADGRLTWRVLSNLLSNAVKYANPGTRLYVDLTEAGDNVLLSMKNISRVELDITPDELLERFRRGDSSRNAEGSGLGLNIAKSLMEVQGGQLNLMLDGDLFKVTLVFPKA